MTGAAGTSGRGTGSDGTGRDRAGRQRGRARAAGASSRTSQAPAQRRRSGDPARTAAFDVLREVGGSDAYANLVLPPLLRSREITGRDAGFATELAYGALRMQGRYDVMIAQAADRPTTAIDAPVLDVLRLGVHQLQAMRVPPHAAVSETVALARARVGAGPAQFVNAVLRAIAAAASEVWLERVADAAGADPLARLAAVQSHPQWIARALRQALAAHGRDPEEIEALLRANNDAAAVALAVRPGLMDPDQIVAGVRGARRGRWSPTAVVLAGGGDPSGIAELRQGLVGVQDEGSQLVTLALAEAGLDGPDARWLDLCAGPGGKSALLGGLAALRHAHLVAVEVAPHRALLVERAVAGLPAGTVDVRCADGRYVGRDEPGTYDRVLLDAPCTGLGALRRRPEARWRRTPGDLTGLTTLQGELLDSALDAVRPGGVVAYVTCSPHVAETRLVVADALRRRADVVQVDAVDAVRRVAVQDLPLKDGLEVQLWPHVHGTDAMHLALLRRT